MKDFQANRLSVFGLILICVSLLVGGLGISGSIGRESFFNHPMQPNWISGNYGGNFRFSAFEPDSLDPADPNTEFEIISQIFEGLTKLDDNLKPVPAVAES